MTETVIIKGLAALTAAITPDEPEEETPAAVETAAAPTRSTAKKKTTKK